MCGRFLRAKPCGLYWNISDGALFDFSELLIFKRKMMESTKRNVSSENQPREQNGKGKCQSCSTGDIQEKMKKVDVKTSSPTSLLAKNTLMLPTGVIRPERVQASAKTKTMSSSGSATGKNV